MIVNSYKKYRNVMKIMKSLNRAKTIKELKKELGFSRSKLRYYLKYMESLGLVKKVGRKGQNSMPARNLGNYSKEIVWGLEYV